MAAVKKYYPWHVGSRRPCLGGALRQAGGSHAFGLAGVEIFLRAGSAVKAE